VLSIGSAGYGLYRIMLDSHELGTIRVNPDPTEWFGPSRKVPLLINNSLPDLSAGILAGITYLLGSFDLNKTFDIAIDLH
jgi:hypothetical protein